MGKCASGVAACATHWRSSIGAPVRSVRCVAGPTRPKPSLAHGEGEIAWRLVSHLSLNYLSLSDDDRFRNAAALHQLLRLYADEHDPVAQRQIEGIKSIRAQLQTRPIPDRGRIVFGRALEILLTLDESAFDGAGIALLGSVLEEFFAKYVSINSMTETVIQSTDRGEVMRWPVRMGTRHTL